MSTSQEQATVEVAISRDPTETSTNRRGWVRDFNGRWRRVRGAVRQRISEDGARLLNDRDQALAVSEFRRFLQRATEDELLEDTSPRNVRDGKHWTAGRIRDAYRTGLRLAERNLTSAGLDADAAERVTRETHQRHDEELRGQYVVTVNDIEDAVSAAVKDASRTFREQVRESAAKAATTGAVNGRLDAVGQTRTKAIANTRTTEAVNIAALTAYEVAGVEAVGVQPEAQPADTNTNYAACCATDDHDHRVRVNASEGAGQVQFVTAGDDRVCPECRLLAGATFSISEVKANQSSLHPPIHPSCRCMLYPMPMEATAGGETVEAQPLR